MAQLNFPEGVTTGTQYTGDNGTTYIFDGIRWIGHSPNLELATNSISNDGNVVQVDNVGNLILPSYLLPFNTGTSQQVLAWPNTGTTLVWTSVTSLIPDFSTNTLVNGAYEVLLDSSGTLNLSGGEITAISAFDSIVSLYGRSNLHLTGGNNDAVISIGPSGSITIVNPGTGYMTGSLPSYSGIRFNITARSITSGIKFPDNSLQTTAWTGSTSTLVLYLGIRA